MKKLLACLLTVVIAIGALALPASAQEVEFEITDNFVEQVRLMYHEGPEISKDDIYIEKAISFPYSSDRYIVKFGVKGCAYPCDMVRIGLGNYIITTSRPVPVVYQNGRLFDLDDGVLSERDLEYLYTNSLLSIEKTKITYELKCELVIKPEDDFVNVMFEVEGSDKDLSDIENWIDDVHGSIEKLDAYYEELHNKLINEVLKDVEHIDKAHNNGISVVAIRKSDVEKVAESDFVVLMDYVSDVHCRYIETYHPYFKEYTYKEVYYGYDENLEPSYVLVNAHGNIGATAVVGFRLGDVVVKSESIYGNFTYKYGVYDIKEDKFYDLFELKDTPDKYYGLESALCVYANAKIAGDSDRDGKLTILDATKIQRCIAQLDDFESDEWYGSHTSGSGLLSDYDNDGEISVLDATAIQIKLAGLEG